MMKISKGQRRILGRALQVWDEVGIRQPITCDGLARDRIDVYGPSYARYNKSMYALLDAGVIAFEVGDRVKMHAYVVDYFHVRAILEQGEVR